jgi:hypothetical protein
MLTENEIKALDDCLENRQEWAENAVSSGIYKDEESALKEKAKSIAERKVNLYEKQNGAISTLKDAQVNALVQSINDLMSNFEISSTEKLEEIESKKLEISNSDKKDSTFQSKVSELIQLQVEYNLHCESKKSTLNNLRIELNDICMNQNLDKFSFITAQPGYKNRAQREAEINLT